MTKPFANLQSIEMVLPINYNDSSATVRRLAKEQYIEEQNSICKHCKYCLYSSPPDNIINKKINWTLFPNYFLHHPIHLHHDHNTGITIGAVHALCNAVLWQYHGE